MGQWNAENARRLRKEADLTQEEVASAVGVERKAVIAWESDSGREPRLGQAAALADLFRVSLDELVHEPDATEPSNGRKQADNHEAPAPHPVNAAVTAGGRAGAR